MEEENGGKKLLISGIIEEANNEAGRIVSEAEKRAKERIESARKRADGIIGEAKTRAAEGAERTRKSVLSGVEVEVKRREMAVREEVTAQILERVRKKLSDLIKSPEYRTLLSGWIVEAAVGLGTKDVLVNGSEAERKLMDARLLKESIKEAGKLTGSPVRISLAGGLALGPQGVVARSKNGRTEYNNGIETRLQRKRRVIQKLLYERLFEDGTGNE
ncbi:MAG: V-type ATP synthase subunit E [Spirochaetes bacterium]|nr:V-type ATP synthase subunit E [Spirochaetota bacterium]